MKIRIYGSNKKSLFVAVFVVIVIAFLLLGGGPWMKGGLMHVNWSIGMASWNWAQILISFFLGILLTVVIFLKKL